MERKVIKFNLIGAICVLILVIAVITGIIVFVVNKKDSGDKTKQKEDVIEIKAEENEKFVEESKEQQEAIPEEIEADKEYKERIIVDGNEQEITMKMHESEVGYKMKYDIDSFFVEPYEDNVDLYESLYTDKIYITVSKEDEDFSNIVTDLANKPQNSSYEISEMNINGKTCIKEQETKANEVYVYYNIEGKDGFFLVKAHCGKELRSATLAIIDKMVESFEVV